MKNNSSIKFTNFSADFSYDTMSNIRAVISDFKDIASGEFVPDFLHIKNYYPYGMFQNELSWSVSNKGLKFGFNSMLRDDEFKGDGQMADFGARIYYSKYGRFGSQDPLVAEFPWQSSYLFAGNNPILNIDNNGENALEYWLRGVGNEIENAFNNIFSTNTQPVKNRNSFKKTSIIVVNNKKTRLIFEHKVSKPFIIKVKSISKNLKLDPNHLMAAMAFETGQTFSPSIKNPNSTATGLIQFMSFTAKGLGTTTNKLAKMTGVEQLSYVEKYLSSYKGKMSSVADVYMAILWPAAVGKSDSYELWNKDNKKTAKAYKANKGLDLNKDGNVTKKEAYSKVEKFLNRDNNSLPKNDSKGNNNEKNVKGDTE